jgi:hypothetical protein
MWKLMNNFFTVTSPASRAKDIIRFQADITYRFKLKNTVLLAFHAIISFLWPSIKIIMASAAHSNGKVADLV